LKKKPAELKILGDGTQTKSHLYASDCADAMFPRLEKTKSQFETCNVGSDEQTSIITIAKIVAETM
jgi:UDP-glucose 4-epimerase